ncbi:MAG: response regulator transcription factor [Pseudomonadales bacterium]|nr:response regulator transcription factor [Pseudomonadales bacterium]
MAVSIIVVDDEQLARQRLQAMIESLDGFEVCAVASQGQEAIDLCRQLQPDIALLDIRMPIMDGMQAAELIAEEGLRTKVIFTTAYDEYAVDAFEVAAQGYLLKPINKEKLEKTLMSVAAKAGFLADGRSHLSASSRGNIELIPLDNVRVLQAEHKYVTVYHTQGESILDESLKSLEHEFPSFFKRVHRNALVSSAHVVSMEKNIDGQYELKVEGCDVQPLVSRRLVSEVRGWMKQL